MSVLCVVAVEWVEDREGGGSTSIGEFCDFLITHGDRGSPPRGERSRRYTETPEPLASRTIPPEGGQTNEFRRRFSGGEIELGAGVNSAGVRTVPTGVCAGVRSIFGAFSASGLLKSNGLSRDCAGVGGVVPHDDSDGRGGRFSRDDCTRDMT